jgi:hypothetical protein
MFGPTEYSDSGMISGNISYEIDGELDIIYLVFPNGKRGEAVLSDVDEVQDILRYENPACPACGAKRMDLGLSSPPPEEITVGFMCPECKSFFKLVDDEIVLFKKLP